MDPSRGGFLGTALEKETCPSVPPGQGPSRHRHTYDGSCFDPSLLLTQGGLPSGQQQKEASANFCA
eukprot:12408431-Karenia_brevis.AAC.1